MNKTRTFYDHITGLYFTSSYKKLGEAITMINMHRMVNRDEPTSLRFCADILGIPISEHLYIFQWSGFDSYEATDSLLILSFDEPEQNEDGDENIGVQLKLFSI